MMTSHMTIAQLRSLIESKKVSAQEVIQFYTDRLKKHNSTLNCAIEIFEQPDAITSQGKLYGIPGLVKDNICQKERITSAGSRILQNYRSSYHATVVDRLSRQGGISLGRANLDEFGMGSSGEFSVYGLTRNPWSLQHSPGGSSSGSAAAVAAGLVPWAIGTETGGSLRQPAASCGLVGMYPTYGRYSRYGLLAFCSSTDQPGVLTKTVADHAYVSSLMSGKDACDTTSLQVEPEDFTRYLTGKIPAGLRVGVLKDSLESDGVDEQIKARFSEAIQSLEKMGATISYISLKTLRYGISTYFVLSRAEAASNLARYDGTLYGNRQTNDDLTEMYVTTRHDGFGKEVQRRILMGNYVLSSGHRDAYYGKAQHARDMLRQEYDDAFKDVDVLLSPTTSLLPFELGTTINDPLALYMGDYFTVPNCILGMPVISIPCGFSKENLPIGFQFMGPAFSEGLLYQVAHAFEQAHDYHTKVPPLFAE